MSTLSTKRLRAEDHGEPEPGGLRERKKPRPLPFRTSPTSKHITLFSQSHQLPPLSVPCTLTPADSDDDDDGILKDSVPLSAQTPKGGNLSFLTVRAQSCSYEDSDLEMTDSQPGTAGLPSPWPSDLICNRSGGAAPSPISRQLINQSLSISGERTATPIYDHFTTNMSLDVMIEVPGSSEAFSGPPSGGPVRGRRAGDDWWRRRCLPSPISEDEDPLTVPVPGPHRSSRPQCKKEVALAEPSDLTISDADETGDWRSPIGDRDVQRSEGRSGLQDPGMGLPRPAAKLACESSALRGSVTRPNGGAFQAAAVSSLSDITPCSSRAKVTIAMGYRADCDKCQRRTPGHYSHIIRS